MHLRITGLDGLQRHLSELQRALKSLDGQIATVKIDGSDPASIETAIAEMEQAVDERIGTFRGNKLVEKIGTEFKESAAAAIHERGDQAVADFERSATEFQQITDEASMDVNPTDQAPATEKDAQRYLVLNYFYEFSEHRCAEEQWSEHAALDLRNGGHSISHGDVARAITYLGDKGLLRVTKRLGYISGEESVVRAGITARGIDAIERPNDFRGVLSPQIINYIFQGRSSMNISHGDQQVIGRDNSGIVAQGQARVRAEMPALPAAQLRADFADHPEAVAAVDSLEAELHAEKPRASVVAAALETIKNAATIAEIGRTFTVWFTDPAVQHHLATIASNAFRP